MAQNNDQYTKLFGTSSEVIMMSCILSQLNILYNNLIQVAQLSQRDRAAGWVSNGQKWKTGTERQYLRTI